MKFLGHILISALLVAQELVLSGFAYVYKKLLSDNLQLLQSLRLEHDDLSNFYMELIVFHPGNRQYNYVKLLFYQHIKTVVHNL